MLDGLSLKAGLGMLAPAKVVPFLLPKKSVPISLSVSGIIYRFNDLLTTFPQLFPVRRRIIQTLKAPLTRSEQLLLMQYTTMGFLVVAEGFMPSASMVTTSR